MDGNKCIFPHWPLQASVHSRDFRHTLTSSIINLIIIIITGRKQVIERFISLFSFLTDMKLDLNL